MVFGVSKVILSSEMLTPNLEDSDPMYQIVEENYLFFFHKMNLEGYKLLKEPIEPATFTFPVDFCDPIAHNIVDLCLSQNQKTVLALSESSIYNKQELVENYSNPEKLDCEKIWLEEIEYGAKLIAYDIS